MTRILTPPDYREPTGPVVFLAGPIQGAAGWQAKASSYLLGNHAALNVANPRRDYLDGTFDYSKQVDWETYHLDLASHTGVILFWLANEAEHDCNRAYAQTTRFELGEWLTRATLGAPVVVGVDTNFTGSKYVHRRLYTSKLDPASTTLKATLDKALSLLTTASY